MPAPARSGAVWGSRFDRMAWLSGDDPQAAPALALLGRFESASKTRGTPLPRPTYETNRAGNRGSPMPAPARSGAVSAFRVCEGVCVSGCECAGERQCVCE